jgi:hypothetical protein
MSRNFDGTNDVLRYSGVVVDATTVDTTPVSFACWIKRGRTSAASAEFLMCSGEEFTNQHYIATLIETDNTIKCRARTTSNAEAISSATITDTSSWHLIVGVFSGIANRTIYVDGNTGVNNTTSRDPVNTTNMFSIGATNETGIGAEFQGLIAYPTVWNNKALSSGDRDTLWNGGAGADPRSVSGATAMWLLDGSATELDQVGSFNLTPTGTTFSSDEPFSLATGSLTARRQLFATLNRYGGPFGPRFF